MGPDNGVGFPKTIPRVKSRKETAPFFPYSEPASQNFPGIQARDLSPALNLKSGRKLPPEGILQRETLRCEKLGTVFRDVHIIFQPNPEFSRKIDSRLVAGGHAGL